MSRYPTDEALEEKARSLRRSLGLEHQAHIDLMTVIQKLKARDPQLQYARVPDYQMPDAESQWDANTKTLRLKESIFQGMQAQHARARMTASHEVSHYVLGHQGVRNRSLAATAAEKFASEVKREEYEARKLAAMMLAPSYLISPADTPSDIAKRFGISLEAAGIRREEVNALERRAAGQRRELPSCAVDFLTEAKRRGYPVQTYLGD